MMERTLTLRYDETAPWQTVHVPGSKSIAARALILEYIYRYRDGRDIRITGLPDCDDTLELASALSDMQRADGGKDCRLYNLGTGGTSLRFFLALAASLPGFRGELDCEEGLRRRPIKPLVAALREAGAEITGDEMPLYVKGTTLNGEGVSVEVERSSQFVSSLMMASLLWDSPFVVNESGLVSAPYVEMTSGLIKKLASAEVFDVEGDWSAAAFFYEFALLNPGKTIVLSGLTRPEKSVQGDSACQEIFYRTGVRSRWGEGADGSTLLYIEGDRSVIKELENGVLPLKFNMKATPDIVPALAVGMCNAGIKYEIKGVGHLRHKESDRLEALSAELKKAGFDVCIAEDMLSWDGAHDFVRARQPFVFSSHGDHRIAMAFAMTAPRLGPIIIEGADSVTKSFPKFYSSISKVGILSTPKQ